MKTPYTNGSIRLALFGAAPDTANMGVSALYASAVTGLATRLPELELVVFDNGLGQRESTEHHGGKAVRVIRFGARGGRRYYRAENLAAMAFASRRGALGARINPGIRLLDSCDAVLDISGGDSFSDIYGRDRFDNIYRPKEIAISRGKPLILLPQTYGPYRDPDVRALAKSVVRRADLAWARDSDSYERLRELLGPDFDSERHRCGVDLAFGLEPVPAVDALDERLRGWIERRDADVPLLGFNVSGLIYNSADGGLARFGLRDDYRDTVLVALRRLLEGTDARLVLVPHVMDEPGHYESDRGACVDVAVHLGPTYAARVSVAPAQLDQAQVKWLISQMDWFCGTRMHSTIAALSAGVPAASISYSDKTRGVFASCGQAAAVFDPRRLPGAEIGARLFKAAENRADARISLAKELPRVMREAEAQLDAVVERLRITRRARAA